MDLGGLRRKADGGPKLVLTYLRTVDNIEELPAAVGLARQLGFDEVVATNLDYVPCESLDRLKVFSNGKPEPDTQTIIDAAEKQAKSVGITLHSYPIEMQEVSVCSENPTRSVFVAFDGSVSPCVYVNLPTRTPRIPRYFGGKPGGISKTIFGNINTQDLWEIWRKPSYQEFRSVYEKRALVSEPTTSAFGSAILWGLLFEQEIPPLPNMCKTCYKAYGI
jgi:MoaA/NifB/PqqE/SkfB family radical SAM enzyme